MVFQICLPNHVSKYVFRIVFQIYGQNRVSNPSSESCFKSVIRIVFQTCLQLRASNLSSESCCWRTGEYRPLTHRSDCCNTPATPSTTWPPPLGCWFPTNDQTTAAAATALTSNNNNIRTRMILTGIQNHVCVCVCVCVWERERERGGREGEGDSVRVKCYHFYRFEREKRERGCMSNAFIFTHFVTLTGFIVSNCSYNHNKSAEDVTGLPSAQYNGLGLRHATGKNS